jgi:hypothetical protein
MKSDEVPILLADTRCCKRLMDTDDGPHSEMRMSCMNKEHCMCKRQLVIL